MTARPKPGLHWRAPLATALVLTFCVLGWAIAGRILFVLLGGGR